MTPDLASEIRRSFEEAAGDDEHFPREIDPRIYHVKVVLKHMRTAGHGRVLDLGCGKGRFARIVKDTHPDARVVAADLAVSMLTHASDDLERVAASMLDLPFADASFDGAYATESLEHAVDIERAVAELCRVLKPGAPLAIIDKNAEHFGKLATPHWEQWFRRDELLKLLRRHCRRASAEYISYWEDVPPDGMFIAWLAVK